MRLIHICPLAWTAAIAMISDASDTCLNILDFRMDSPFTSEVSLISTTNIENDSHGYYTPGRRKNPLPVAYIPPVNVRLFQLLALVGSKFYSAISVDFSSTTV